MTMKTVLSAAAGVLAVTAVLALATPAQAGWDGWRSAPHERGGHEWRERYGRPDHHSYLYERPAYRLAPLPYRW